MLQPWHESNYFHFGEEKQRCLSNYTKSKFCEWEIFLIKLNIKANWTANLNYWTGGFQE
jgi:hypothetical protein